MSTSHPYTEAWLQGPQSTQFYTRTYTSHTPPKAVVVFIHGFAEHVGRYTHFHPLIVDRGMAVFALDQRGFGRTAQDLEGHKSSTSAYGKTSWKEQMDDINWALTHAKAEFSEVPVFLMGHSMGGGEVLGFATQGETSPHHGTVSSLAGIIATSPLIHQTKPASKILRWDLSRDASFNDAYLKDPLIKQAGSLRGLHDMLSHGEYLLETYYKYWPKSLPVLLIHGTEDKLTSYKATESFHDKISAVDKRIALYEGGFHELQNEPDGVKEKLADEVVAFIEAHITPEAEVSERSKM